MRPQNDGQPFAVHDVLHDGPHHPPRALKHALVESQGRGEVWRAKGLQAGRHLGSDDVVEAEKDGMDGGQGRLLVDPLVT